MKLLLLRIAIYGFNQRFLTEEDFYKICEAEGIEIIWSDKKFSWYMTVESVPFIVLPRRARGLKLLFKMFHELAHHFRHYGELPTQVYFHELLDNKDEMEADAIATIALVPKHGLDSYDFLEEHPNKFARRIYEDRKKVEFLYGE